MAKPKSDARSYAPPPEAIAFALAIVKSTPAHMSATDYALELRNHLKRGQQPSGPEQGRYIDLVSYWQQRCHQLVQENEKLKTRNTMLERAHQLRENQVDNEETQANDQKITTSPAKRKRAVPETRKSTRTKAAEQTEGMAAVSLEEDLDLVEGLEDGLLVMKHTWSFHKLLRQPDADSVAVCTSLVGMASSLGNVVHNLARGCARPVNRGCQRQGLPTLAEDRSECARELAACGRIFGMLLTGLERLNSESLGKHLSEKVIYECVKMFSVALGAIETSARQSAIKSIQSKADEGRESLSSRLVAHYLTGLMGFLDQDNVLHQKLFDGFTFTLLERVSKHLYHCVFGQHRGATIAEDIISTVPSKQSDSKREAERLVNRFEMKALVVILERALSRAPSYMNPQPMSKNQSMNPRAPTRSRALSMINLPSKGRLSPIAKDRLQRTLVACMYGDKIEDDFMDLLTGPVDLGTIPNMPKVVDQSVEEWYQEQIWKLVGWDIMVQESSWLKHGPNPVRT